jgi:hypothetical protein
MIKKTLGILLIAIIAITGSVFAYQGFGMHQNNLNPNSENQTYHERGQFHEQMEEILEQGTYDDLVAFREEVGFDVMRKVQSVEDFEAQKARHELRESQGLEPGYKRAGGHGSKHRGFGNCPMSN